MHNNKIKVELMMVKKKFIAVLFTYLFFTSTVFSITEKTVADKQTVLVTTFPIYQIVRNITQGQEDIKVDLMLPSQFGCPLDYSLTPQDMRKLAQADILVVNGLGMEEFLGAPVEKANSDIKVIGSSTGIKEILQYTGEQSLEHVHDHHAEHPFEWAGAFTLEPGVYLWSFAKVNGQYADPAMKMLYIKSVSQDSIEQVEKEAEKLFEQNGQILKHNDRLLPRELNALQFDINRNSTVFEVYIEKVGTYVFFTEHMPSEFEAGEHFFKTTKGKDVEPFAQEPEEGHHHHHHSGANPHLFASPRMTAQLAMNIAAGLSKIDPEGAAIYFKNAHVYAETMNSLADEMTSLGKSLKNNRIVEPHGVFDYLARDIGLQIVAVMQPHGQEPSAAEMVNLVKVIREKNAGAIFTEPQYPKKAGKVLSKETGIPIAMLDPVATGPDNAPLNYYESIMRQNMKTLVSTLGVK